MARALNIPGDIEMLAAKMKSEAQETSIMSTYMQTVMMLERLHRRLQEVVKDALIEKNRGCKRGSSTITL